MTVPSHISIAAFVSAGERTAVRLAADHIAKALSKAAESPWTCECTFSPDLESLPQNGSAAMIVTSFLPLVEKDIEEPWPQVEQRLRSAYIRLSERGVPVFICTILRHVGDDETPESRAALRIRILRFNLLAAEISRETGAYVIDVDRVLADVGARRIQTDYRLAGNAAAEMAGHFMALTLVGNAVDAVVAFELQDAAREILTSSRPVLAELDGAKPEITLKKDLMSMGRGRQKQIISPVLYTVQENYIGWLTRQVLRGAIGPREAIQRLVLAIRRRGLRESVFLLASGLSKQLSRKK